MTQRDDTSWAAPPVDRRARRVGRIAFWVLVVLAAGVLAACIAIPIVTMQPYTEQSPTMENTIHPGDQMFVANGSGGLRRGDVVILRVPVRLSHTSDVFVKRVIGLPGDHVACCDARGRITVNGRPLNETYLYPGDRPSRVTFSVTVGRGQIWVLGDRRNISLDSRRWGPVPESGVVGRVVLAQRGSHLVFLRTPPTFIADGLAPADTRPDFYLGLAIGALVAVAALLLLTFIGTSRFVIRRRRARREAERARAEAQRARADAERARADAQRGRPGAARGLVEPMWGVYRVPPDRPGGEDD
ncbi:MAG TPA: signal peptidase I [Streptosporangiaceae bacterium]|nr:signal peptidase I [Streptosporangiaceae bacterium]